LFAERTTPSETCPMVRTEECPAGRVYGDPMMFSDHPVIAESCRKASSYSCPYIQKNMVLNEADQAQALYNNGRISEIKLNETITLLEDSVDAEVLTSCPTLNISGTCPVSVEMNEGDRLETALGCNSSAQYNCPHLRVGN
jgi:hypothetical protein